MPFCEVRDNSYGTLRIFYRTYGRGPVKVLLIAGLASAHGMWGPQIMGLTGRDRPTNVEDDWSGGVEVCAFDNRGMGRTSVPTNRSQYTTQIMANDAIALLDHLGWKKAHVFGHSMGAMIACKVSALVPDRVLSLALLNVTGGGFECLPKLDSQTLSIAFRFLRAKTPQERAAVDLDTHYSKEYLEEYVGCKTRRSILFQEYVKGISSSGMQSSHGFDGQINACWTHKMTWRDIETMRSAGFLISVIHGRHDVIAQLYYARRLAEKLQPVARMIDLNGGHLVSHERTEEVNNTLFELIKASEKGICPHDWTNLLKKTSGWLEGGMASGTSTNGVNYVSKQSSVADKLHMYLLYIFSLFAFLFEYLRRAHRNLKPVRGSLIWHFLFARLFSFSRTN